ncbi:His-Xaa-Ser system radical SAM maturase HxsB [Candidatus Woesearchaeota archaeon]|nr:His-Xaa-Ser system radical SAM maturase HxsB [Candidatus Woesearchaeota archaeon]
MTSKEIEENNEKIEDFIIQRYRTRKLSDKDKNKILLTADTGAWTEITDEEFSQIKSGLYSSHLFNNLKTKGIIVTPDNHKTVISDYAKRYHFLLQGPSLHIIIPTLRCNHKCIYCHSSARPGDEKNSDMTEETADKIVNLIFQTSSNALTIEFQGGEGLLNFNILKYIAKKAIEKNVESKKQLRFDLVTNLSALDNEKIEWIAENQINVCTSLDGPKHVHDKNRLLEGGRSSYDQVMLGMKKLREKGIGVSALMVTTRHSLNHSKEIIDEYISLGLPMIQLKYLSRLGFADKNWDHYGYTPDEFINFWKESMDYIIDLNKKGVVIKERLVVIMLKKILGKYDPGFVDMRSPCGAVIGQIAYNYDGKIYSCDEGRNFDLFMVGDVKLHSLRDIFGFEKTKNIISSSINDSFLCDVCAYKPYCGTCPVLNYAEHGNIVPKLPKNSRCKIQKFQFDYVFSKLLFDEKAREVLFSWIKPKEEKRK